MHTDPSTEDSGMQRHLWCPPKQPTAPSRGSNQEINDKNSDYVLWLKPVRYFRVQEFWPIIRQQNWAEPMAALAWHETSVLQISAAKVDAERPEVGSKLGESLGEKQTTKWSHFATAQCSYYLPEKNVTRLTLDLCNIWEFLNQTLTMLHWYQNLKV